ncbi:MAG TPA: YsnF/AvaK domain-containing protein [Bryobacteraceae bacterium]|nr:YsnF/AvaK domain-containing protein [Bryobacteraceae bacterium]
MTEQHEKTVIGVFDDYQTAQQARRDLESQGIASDKIRVESNFRTGAAGYGAAEQSAQHEGGFTGFLHRMFGENDEEGGHYSEAVRRGSAVVAVTVPQEQADQVARIMNDRGAIDIDRRADYYRQSGYTRHDASAAPYTRDQAERERDRFRTGENATAVPVIEEELEIGKRVVRRGGVRVYSHVVEQPVEEQVSLREEHVRVDRRRVNRPAEPGEMGRLRDQTIEVVETVEEPVISKRARVREEVVVNKEATQRTETVHDKVRRTEVRVDQMDKQASAPAPNAQAAVDFGNRAATDARYSGGSWSDVEPDLRADYERTHPGSKWDEVKADIRSGWDKVTGRR